MSTIEVYVDGMWIKGYASHKLNFTEQKTYEEAFKAGVLAAFAKMKENKK